MVVIRRGDVYLADLEPVVGSEADKRRPVVIVSNDAANRSVEQRGTGVVTVVPLTSNVAIVRSFQALIPSTESGLRANSKAQAEQIRALSPRRLVRPIGRVAAPVMAELDRAIRLHLDL